METSRDDFVIAIRSAFLKKGTQQRFSLLSLIFLAILFIFLGSLNFKIINYIEIAIKELVYRASFVISVPENYIEKSYITVNDHLNLYEQYTKTKLELKNLKSKNIVDNFIVLENKRLKQVINEYLVESEGILAKVLIDKQSPFSKSVIVNKGSRNNIKMGMIVIDNKYLVGKVVEVNYLTSRILLLSDLNSKIPVLLEPSGIQSILSGSGEHHGVLQYLKNFHNIDNENIVYTSGSGALFKAGIPVGKIRNNGFSI